MALAPVVQAQTSRILFSRPAPDGEGQPQQPDIWIMDDDGSDQENLSDEPTYVDGAPTACGATEVVFSRNEAYTFDIFIMDVDGSNQVNLTSSLDSSHEQHPRCAYIDDETLIVYTSDVDDSEGEIYTMEIDGSNKTRLTNNSLRESGADWCKEDIIFHRDIAPELTNPCNTTVDEIFIMDNDGNNVRQLTDDCHGDHAPSCSPDGSVVAFERVISYAQPPHPEIFRMDICGGTGTCCSDGPGVCSGMTRLTTDFFADDKAPAWSPGGSAIVFSSNRSWNGSTDFDVYKMDAEYGEDEDDGFLENLTDTAAGFHDESPYWAEVRED